MQRKISILILLFLLNGAVLAQFKAQASIPDMPVNTQGLSSVQNLSLFAPERFNMNHSFSLSTSYAGGRSLGLGIYTNQMSFMLKDNFSLQTQVSLMQPSGAQNANFPQDLNSQIFYGASLNYEPFENFHISLNMNNYPRYSLYRPYSSFSLTP